MSTATVSSPKKSKQKLTSAAKWDDENNGTLLEVLDNEINNGNRPAGVYSKTGWFNILSNFKERTGLDYTRDQIKNRMDNLRRDYIRWEKLIGKETGLGWDHQKRTLAAPDHWWYEKSKSEPGILKYKDGGPIHLELMQRVFGGVTATGAHRYYPDSNDLDPLLDVRSQIQETDHIIDFTTEVETNEPLNDSAIPSPQITSPSLLQSTSKLNPRKRVCGSSSGRQSEVDKFGKKVDSITETIKESMTSYIRSRTGADDSDEYADAIATFRSIPGMHPGHPAFMKGVRVLENKLRRVAFNSLIDLGLEAILSWLRTFSELEN